MDRKPVEGKSDLIYKWQLFTRQKHVVDVLAGSFLWSENSSKPENDSSPGTFDTSG